MLLVVGGRNSPTSPKRAKYGGQFTAVPSLWPTNKFRCNCPKKGARLQIGGKNSGAPWAGGPQPKVEGRGSGHTKAASFDFAARTDALLLSKWERDTT